MKNSNFTSDLILFQNYFNKYFDFIINVEKLIIYKCLKLFIEVYKLNFILLNIKF